MKVVATINRSDLLRLNLYVLPRHKGNWYFLLGFAVLAFAYLTYTSEAPITPRLVAYNLYVALLGAVGGLIVGTVICLVFVLAFASEKGGVLGKHEFELTNEGFREKTSYNEQLNGWKGIHSVARSSHAIYVRLNSYLMHVIPRQAFASEQEFDRFFDQACQYWKSTQKT